MLSDKSSVRNLVELCYQYGIKQVVISPGSRNAPLIISFAEHGSFECLSIIDERSAAFFALGLSQSSDLPTALVCTSGSALLNYSPAIVEAFYQHIPLLILSADRPSRWIGQGEGQSMNQTDVYKNFIQSSITLLEPSINDHLSLNVDLINHSLSRLNIPTTGPVHINIPLDEPLYGRSSYKNHNTPILKAPKSNGLSIADSQFRSLRETWDCSSKILILIGQMNSDIDLLNLLEEICEQYTNITVLTETTSNLNSPYFISNIDRNLAQMGKVESYFPDLLITLGHNIVSKKVKQWLRSHQLRAHWHIDEKGDFQDTFEQLTESIQILPSILLKKLNLSTTHPTSNYQNIWHTLAIKSNASHVRFLSQCEWSDLKSFEIITSSLPDQTHLQLANSTVIRYMQLFKMNPTWIHHSNRGISGIDGCTSTALGYGWNTENLTVFITGDISFGYDSNAFWHQQLKGNMRIIVISNGGGGIFRFIPGPSTTNQLEEYFETPRSGHVQSICNRHALPYFFADDEISLRQTFSLFFNKNEENKPMVLEISTPRLINDEILRSYFKSLA